LAPLGLDDLLSLRIAPTPHARSSPRRLAEYRARLAAKPWRELWPELTLDPG
jgi:hypothetical protein